LMIPVFDEIAASRLELPITDGVIAVSNEQGPVGLACVLFDLCEHDRLIVTAEHLCLTLLIELPRALFNHDFWCSLDVDSYFVLRQTEDCGLAFSARGERNQIHNFAFSLIDRVANIKLRIHEVLEDSALSYIALQTNIVKLVGANEC
jgi:hypothetical protein